MHDPEVIVKTVLVITILTASALAIFVYARHGSSHLRTLLLIHFAGIAGWAASTLAVLEDGYLFAAKCAFASAMILAIAKCYFIYIFPKKQLDRKPWLLLPLFLGVIAIVLSFKDGLFFTHVQVVNGYYVQIENGPYASYYSIVIALFLIYPVIKLSRGLYARKYAGHVRDQARFLLIGISVFFCVGLLSNSVLPVFFNIYYFNGMGPSFALVLAGFILYIISRHNFLGLSILIQRGIIYSILFGGITALYLALLFPLDLLFTQAVNANAAISGIITTVFGIMTVPHIDAYLRKLTDPLFFKGSYDYSEVLYGLSKMLSESIDIEAIKTHTCEVLAQTLKAERVTISTFESPHETRSGRRTASSRPSSGMTIPLINENEKIGEIILGDKRSGDPYSHSDMQLLSTLSNHLAVALERALLHKQVQDYSKELEGKVRARTAELNEAYENQRLMIANIAHGLQTPLTVMQNELSLAQKSEYAPLSFTALERSLQSVSTFIYDLLKLVQLESGSQFSQSLFNASALTDETLSYVRTLAENEHIELVADIQERVYLSGDPKRFEELLLCLLSNAIKYMREDGLRQIIVRLAHKDGEMRLLVADTGIGIPKEHLDKIFQRFYRVRNTQQKKEGSGLGLAIARAIVEKHKGTISVESEYGMGTEFTVSIPAIAARIN